MRPKQLYVIIKGRKIGVFNAWSGADGVESQVKGFSGAEYKGKFYNVQDAINYFVSKNGYNPEIHFEIEKVKEVQREEGNYTTYVIIDPRNKTPFYVGQTKNFIKRKQAHLRVKKKVYKKVDKYILDLQEEGLEPDFYVAEICNCLEDSLASELKWVKYCLNKGYLLCNRWKEHRI